MSRCKECRKPVIWAKTPRGTSIALDYTKVDEGDLFAVNGDVAVPVPLVERFAYRQRGQRLYPVHKTLCQGKAKKARKVA